MNTGLDVESAVKERYSAASRAKVEELCCPVQYDAGFLRVIPKEVLERDYGCGDPSKHLHPGETVLDLGSGAGKICFIAAQVVGAKGRVIGIDMNDDMLALARKHAGTVAMAIGYNNVEFRKGRIQDLTDDLENPNTLFVETESIDVVISSCVLNLVKPSAKKQLFSEIFRVLRIGGRAVISDIVSDKPVPEELQADPELWSGCISGALTHEAFVNAFETAGFNGVEILKLDENPWRTVGGIEFRAMTVRAFKGKNQQASNLRGIGGYKAILPPADECCPKCC